MRVKNHDFARPAPWSDLGIKKWPIYIAIPFAVVGLLATGEDGSLAMATMVVVGAGLIAGVPNRRAFWYWLTR